MAYARRWCGECGLEIPGESAHERDELFIQCSDCAQREVRKRQTLERQVRRTQQRLLQSAEPRRKVLWRLLGALPFLPLVIVQGAVGGALAGAASGAVVWVTVIPDGMITWDSFLQFVRVGAAIFGGAGALLGTGWFAYEVLYGSKHVAD